MTANRIAVISDIDGNFFALKAVLDDLRRRDIDQVINLGDCVSGPYGHVKPRNNRVYRGISIRASGLPRGARGPRKGDKGIQPAMNLLAALLLFILSGAAEAQVFDPAKVGPPLSNGPAELYLPVGATPVGAVVVLHGCDGVGLHDREWGRRLVQWGFAALLIDSFRPRGYREVCNRGRLVPPEAQARDAFDGAAYLRAAPEVLAQRVGVIGFSHGGWAVLKAVLAGLVRRSDEPPFAAAIAFYPGCDPPTAALETDTLILIGDADDWTPVARCAHWRDAVQTNGHTLRMKIYPGARHSFDLPSPPHSFAGHYIGQDPAGLADSLVETRTFFTERLVQQRSQ